MRVIAGTARSVPLEAPKGMETRPTTDKIKETLFNILNFDIPGCCFVDLFSGSGAIGIEALSRGAERAFFIDNAKASVDVIERNLLKTRLNLRATVLKSDALAAVSRLKGRLPEQEIKIFFLDPPYDQGLEEPVLRALMSEGLIDEESIVVVEMSPEGDLSGMERFGYEIYREKIYKNQKHVFLRKV